MRTLILIAIGLGSLTVHGQITNTINRDQTNLYYHALDTAVKIIQTRIRPAKLIVEGDPFAVNRLPQDIFGISIIKNDGQKRVSQRGVDAIVTINRLEVNNGEFSIFIQLWTVENGKRRVLEQGIGSYSFNYEFLQANRTFKLARIDKSIIIR